MDPIPLIEPVVGDEELDNVREVLESGWMTEGPFAEELQEGVSDLTGVAHATTVTSCTTGLEVALDALGVGPGDEIVLPDFTYPATANVVVRLGATPVLVDVKPTTYNIDPERVAEAITEDTVAIMPVSLFGHPVDPGPIQRLADDHNLAVVEDAAWSLGSEFDGQAVGSQFDVSVFSFHPRKILTTGEGGAITTDDDALMREMRTIKNFGLSHYEDNEGFVRADATNYRMSDILAAVGVAQLQRSDEIFERRREVATRYDKLLASVDGIQPPHVDNRAHHTYGSYCAYVDVGDDTVRDNLIDLMSDRDIETQIGTYALHRTDAFDEAERATTLEVSADLYHNLLTLPITHSMTEADQERVVNALDEELERFR